MAKQAREVGLVYDLPHLLQGEYCGPVSCAKASQEEVAEDLYSVCVCGVCVWVYLSTNFSPRLSCTVSRLFITLHKNKLQVHWVKSQEVSRRSHSDLHQHVHTDRPTTPSTHAHHLLHTEAPQSHTQTTARQYVQDVRSRTQYTRLQRPFDTCTLTGRLSDTIIASSSTRGRSW